MAKKPLKRWEEINFLKQNISSGHDYKKNSFPKKGGSNAQEIKTNKCRN
jgi:hypothetical protein